MIKIHRKYVYFHLFRAPPRSSKILQKGSEKGSKKGSKKGPKNPRFGVFPLVPQFCVVWGPKRVPNERPKREQSAKKMQAENERKKRPKWFRQTEILPKPVW